MKLKWSVIPTLALLLLASCGKEEFGSTPTTNTAKAEAVKEFEQHFCEKPSVINPKLDVLYLVDNSSSTYYLPDDIKLAIRDTVNSISLDFDYRVVGTGLLATDETPFNDYQVLTNSQDPLSPEASSKKIISASELNFFMQKPAGGVLEAGLRRAVDFINYNVENGSGLFRPNANLLIILFSNGRDTDIEKQTDFGNGETLFQTTVYNERVRQFKDIKSRLTLSQLRLISVTAKSVCKPGWFSSVQSYVKMANQLYSASGATDASVAKDSYDLCAGVANVFAPVNQSIQMVKINHSYRYWPITFANSSHVRNDFGTIFVNKVENGASVALQENTDWAYYEHTGAGPLNVREPLPGEPLLPGGEISGKHFVRFSTPVISPPACVQIKSSTRTEYFGYVVLNQEPKPDSIVLRINGKGIPKSNTDGWSYVGNRPAQNIKMPHPNSGDQFPALYKSGFMLQLNGVNNYYKSGDSIETNFIAAPL